MLFRLFVSCLAGFCILLTLGAPQAAAQKKIALVIGIDAYEKVPRLQRAVEDARAVAAALRELGFGVREIEDARYAEISRRLAAFNQEIDRGDTVFVFLPVTAWKSTARICCCRQTRPSPVLRTRTC